MRGIEGHTLCRKSQCTAIIALTYDPAFLLMQALPPYCLVCFFPPYVNACSPAKSPHLSHVRHCLEKVNKCA